MIRLDVLLSAPCLRCHKHTRCIVGTKEERAHNDRKVSTQLCATCALQRGQKLLSAWPLSWHRPIEGGLMEAEIDGLWAVTRNEDIAYARRLADAGVPTELHVYPGCPHAFEALARDAAVSRRAISDRVRRLRAL